MYSKVVTAGNDPTITTSGRYSQVVNGSSKCYRRIIVAQAIADGILNPDGSANFNNKGSSSVTNTNIQCPVYK